MKMITVRTPPSSRSGLHARAERIQVDTIMKLSKDMQAEPGYIELSAM